MAVTRARTSFAVLFLAALAMLLTACGSSASAAARIGDDEISKDELAVAVGVYRSIFTGQQGDCGLPDPAAEPDPTACERAVLGDLVLTNLAEDYASTNGIEVPETEVDAAVASLEEQYGAEQLREAFATNGVTRQDLVDLVRASLLQQAVVEAVTIEELGEDGLRSRYEEQIADFSTIEVDHVLVASQAEARDVYESATAEGFSRQDFRDLAKQVSTDPGVAENGGTYGPVAATTFDPAFASGALALEPGEISEPIKTQFGWHVIRLESKEVSSFEEVREQVVGQESTAVFGDWLRRRVEDVDVEVNPGLGRYDPETFTVVRIQSTDPDAEATPSLSGAGG